MRTITLATITLILIFYASIGNATTKHALIVGVSEYPNLKPRLSLTGPKNDAALINDFLLSQQFDKKNITLLADGIDNAVLPTRQNIVNALDNLVKVSQQGDFVYMHFAGHGSQQPVKPNKNKPGVAPDETDGLDEIFLPRDVEEWNHNIGEVKNALVDDTIGQAIDAIRKKGAFVWIIFDSCHSGTMTRNAPVEEEFERRVDPTDLGIPNKLIAMAENHSENTRGIEKSESFIDDKSNNDSKMGGYVAFYAAQTTETTPEMNLPKGDAERKLHGLFTYNIIKAMSSRPGITYRQVAQKILQQYSIMNRHKPTPLFEGKLDYVALSDSDQPGNTIRQWKVSPKMNGSIKLKAGSLHQLNNGSILGIYKYPTDDDKDVLGYIEITNAKLTESTAKNIKYNDKPALSKLPKSSYARLHASNISYRLTVALTENTDGNTKHPGAQINTIAKAIKKDNPELSLELVDAGEQADIRLHIDKAMNKLWFLPPTGQSPEENPHIQNFIPIKSGQINKNEMAAALSRIAKVSNLLKLGDSLDNQMTAALQAQLFMQRDNQWVEIQSHEAPTLKDQQEIKILLTNNSNKPIDVTLLFVDSLYGITPVFPNSGQTVNRIEPKGSVPVAGAIDASMSTGNEGFMVIAVEAEPQSQIANFSFLGQTGFSRGADIPTGLSALLSQAGFGQNRSRGFGLTQVTSSAKSNMQLFRWTTAK